MRSLQTTRNAVFKGLLLASGAGLALASVPAMAQDANEGDVLEEPTPSGEGIVVTGSRIVRQDFESTIPIVTVG